MKEINLEKLSFEDALIQLENIVRELEAGKIKLDNAVEAYEKATALKKFCEEKLKAAQLKIEKINVEPDGNITVSDFDKVEED
ncbi:MAG: exodeoxyribonuclease VII small subunit [Alphaproteobacteria bacterium]|nr:exodeoxyribonuclease VII small subunit [Alphaproteobacteria bacterium]